MKKVKDEKIEKIKQRIRVKTMDADEEVEDLVKTCIRELEIAGVYGSLEDETYFQAVVLYCKANYGYDENTERFQRAYEKLRDAMNLSGEYKKVEEHGN